VQDAAAHPAQTRARNGRSATAPPAPPGSSGEPGDRRGDRVGLRFRAWTTAGHSRLAMPDVRKFE